MDYAMWLLFAAVAAAQDSPPTDTEADDGPPLAIPIPEEPAAVEVLELAPRDDRGADGRAIRTYREQFLALRTFGETQVGTTWDYTPVGRWGPYGYRTGWRAWPRPYVVRTTSRGVFQGQTQLDVPSTLAALGDDAARQDLDRRIQTNQTLGNVSYGLGVAGVAASVVGLIALDQCCSSPVLPGDVDTLRAARTWSTVSASGVVLLVGGFIGGTIPSGRAQRLQYDYATTLDLDVLGARIAEHNEQLAAEFGLTPTEAARVESHPRRRKDR